MTKGCAVIVLLLLTAMLGDSARIFGFKPFYLKRDSHVKMDPVSSYASVGVRTPRKEVLVHKGHLNMRESVKKHPGSETKLKLTASTNSKDLHVYPRELRQQIFPAAKFDAVERQMKKIVEPFQPLRHSPGIGHDDPPGLKH